MGKHRAWDPRDTAEFESAVVFDTKEQPWVVQRPPGTTQAGRCICRASADGGRLIGRNLACPQHGIGGRNRPRSNGGSEASAEPAEPSAGAQ